MPIGTVIVNPLAARISCQSGLAAQLQKEYITLNTLKNTIEEAVRSAPDEANWERIKIATMGVSVVCNVILTIVSSQVSAGVAATAMGINALYNSGNTIINAFNGDFSASDALIRTTNTKVDAIISALESAGKNADIINAVSIYANLAYDLYKIYDESNFTLVGSIAPPAWYNQAIGTLQKINIQIEIIEAKLSNCGYNVPR